MADAHTHTHKRPPASRNEIDALDWQEWERVRQYAAQHSDKWLGQAEGAVARELGRLFGRYMVFTPELLAESLRISGFRVNLFGVIQRISP
jgi:hypothetical protein